MLGNYQVLFYCFVAELCRKSKQTNYCCKISLVNYAGELSLFNHNVHAMILIFHIFMNVNKLCLNQTNKDEEQKTKKKPTQKTKQNINHLTKNQTQQTSKKLKKKILKISTFSFITV